MEICNEGLVFGILGIESDTFFGSPGISMSRLWVEQLLSSSLSSSGWVSSTANQVVFNSLYSGWSFSLRVELRNCFKLYIPESSSGGAIVIFGSIIIGLGVFYFGSGGVQFIAFGVEI